MIKNNFTENGQYEKDNDEYEPSLLVGDFSEDFTPLDGGNPFPPFSAITGCKPAPQENASGGKC